MSENDQTSPIISDNSPNNAVENSKAKKGSNKFVKIVILFLVILTLVFGAIYGIWAYYQNQISKPLMEIRKTYNLEGDKLNFTIKKGTTTDEVGAQLVKEGLISKPEILKVYMFLNKDKTIQAGYYRLELTDMNLKSLVDTFQKGSFEKKLTFIEGWRTEEYVDYLRENMGEDFATTFGYSEYLKEGYMFPDTYIIEADYDPANLASWMRNTFKKKVSQDLIDKAEFGGMTMDEVIILASILEREMNIKKDLPIVAGILIKRLQNDWPLQADATVQYAKGTKADWWPKVTGQDTKTIDSPYNTYLNKGLPPAPIANPGIEAIEAVINYEETPYWFYITDSKGTTHYAETLEEHNQNIQEYLR